MDGMFEVLEKFNELLTKNRTKFIAGDRLTIADLLFFHEMTNLVYLGVDHEKYREVKRWYAEVYQVPEVKAITHEWYQSAKLIMKSLQSVEIIKAKL
jgi:glutathione S-transferase